MYFRKNYIEKIQLTMEDRMIMEGARDKNLPLVFAPPPTQLNLNPLLVSILQSR